MPDLCNRSTMFPAAAEPAPPPPGTIMNCIKEVDRLRAMCSIWGQDRRLDRKYLDLLRSSCDDVLYKLRYNLIFEFDELCDSWLWEMVLDLRKRVEHAQFVVFSISSYVGRGIHINMGSHRMYVPYNLRVNHPLLQMVLFASNLHDDSFACPKSSAPKSIARMAKISGSSASPTEYIAGWISAHSKSESPNAVRNPPCRSKKLLLPVLFNISAIKKTSITVYDSSMTVADGNCGVSNKCSLEIGKAGNRLSFREESNNCQQRGALTVTGSSHQAQGVTCIYYISMEKMPTQVGSVKCGDADESSMLAKQTSPQEHFVLNCSGDGGRGNPRSNSAPRVIPFAETTLTPTVPDLIQVDPQHLREIDFASEVYILEAIHTMNSSQGINADRPMHRVYILDSGSPEHCTGDKSQLSEYHTEVRSDRYLRGAGGTLMRVHGTGLICNENFQVKDVLYVPDLNNLPNINKTIFSVAKLNELGLSVHFNSDGTCSVIDKSKWTWNLKHEIVGRAQKDYGHFMMDYLRIPLNRDPVPMLERPGFLKLLQNASCSVWRSITGHPYQRTTCPQRQGRLPV